jgi:hypothetical protein
MRDLETPFKLSHRNVLVYDTLEVLLWVLYPKAYSTSNELKKNPLSSRIRLVDAKEEIFSHTYEYTEVFTDTQP